LLVIPYDFIVYDAEFYASLLEHFNRIGVGVVAFLADDPFNACVDYYHCACSARRHLAIECCSLEWYPESGRLDNRVLLGVEGTYAVLGDFTVVVEYFAQVVSCFVAVRQSRWGANVACGHDTFIFNDYGAASASVAGCTCSHRFTHI
jgi:hypothetical protein